MGARPGDDARDVGGEVAETFKRHSIYKRFVDLHPDSVEVAYGRAMDVVTDDESGNSLTLSMRADPDGTDVTYSIRCQTYRDIEHRLGLDGNTDGGIAARDYLEANDCLMGGRASEP